MTVQPNTSMTARTHPFSFVCDKFDCYHRTGHKTREDAERTEREHVCMPKKANYLLDSVDERGQRYTALHMGKSIVENLWDQLDKALDLLSMEEKGTHSHGVLTGKCQAYAFSIQSMLSHFYPEVRDVTVQAVQRQKIRRGEAEWQPTPGYQFNPPPPSSKAYAEAQKRMSGDGPGAKTKSQGTADKRGASSGPAKAEKSFTQEQIDGIRNARDSGLLSPEQLAESFKVSVEFVKGL